MKSGVTTPLAEKVGLIKNNNNLIKELKATNVSLGFIKNNY